MWLVDKAKTLELEICGHKLQLCHIKVMHPAVIYLNVNFHFLFGNKSAITCLLGLLWGERKGAFKVLITEGGSWPAAAWLC